MDDLQQAAEQLFGEVLDLPPDQRLSILERECATRPELRRRVEDLLDQNDGLKGFMSASPVQQEGRSDRATAPLTAGTRLGRYSIVERLGSGGMGVVYRARDEKLERDVALKMLSPGMLAGEEARRHFRREALALAKLNHPRIAAVYDVGEQDGADYIVMELVEGESLAAKLAAGALPVTGATAIALQVAEALEEAHERGVIHRDLKPANVMITGKGHVKVLDFGLAKMLATGGTDATVSLAETGVVLGTPRYMSPEQAVGRSLDARTDLWSLGLVYYECLMGRPPFRAEKGLAVLHAITAEPLAPLREVRPDLPSLAEQIVLRALEKDREMRYQRAADMATDLKRLIRDLDPRSAAIGEAAAANPVSAASPGYRHGNPRRTLVIGSAALAALLAVAWLMRPAVPAPQVTGITQLTHDGLPKLYQGAFPESPMMTDGTRVYFEVAGPSRTAIMDVSTEGGESERVQLPFAYSFLVGISPPRSELLLLGPPSVMTKTSGLWSLPIPAGQPRRVGNLLAFDATWAPDGNTIYYTAGPEIWVANGDGSQVRRILTLTNQLYGVRFAPDGRSIRFSSMDEERNTHTLWEADVDGGHPRQLLSGWDACCGAWTPNGKYFVFASTRGGNWNLWAMRVERDWWLKTNPDPVRLTVGQMSSQVPLPSMDGKKIFFVGATERAELVRFDLNKQVLVSFLPGLSAEGLAFTGDGTRMVYTTVPEGNLWQSRADGSDRHELTFSPMRAWTPRWSPDGTRIAFAGQEPEKTSKIYMIPVEGGVPEQLTSGEFDDTDPSWSPQGDAVAFGGLYHIALTSKEHPIQVLNLRTRRLTTLPDSGQYLYPSWSPDGHRLLATDVHRGTLVLYDFDRRTWQPLTTIPADYASWSQDGKCVTFSSTVDVKIGVYRVCLSDRKPRLLANLPGNEQLAPGSFRGWMAPAPDGSILAARDISLQEVYALDVRFP